MSGYTVRRTVSKDEIPPARAGGLDYSKILKALATLELNEGLEIEIKKKHYYAGIRRSVEKNYKTISFSFSTRTVDGALLLYIVRE